MACSWAVTLSVCGAPTIQILGIEGGPAPGFSDEWRSNGYRAPSLNNNGQVAAAGFAERGTTGNIEGAQALWLFEPDGGATLLAREGDTIPGTTANTELETIFTPAINDSGEILFQAHLINPSDPGDTTRREALIRAGQGTGVQAILQQGDTFTAPSGETGSIVEFRGFWDLNESGIATVQATIETPSTGSHGSPVLIDGVSFTPQLFRDEPAPGFNDGTTTQGGGNASFNDNGELAYLTTIANVAPGTGDLAIIGPTAQGTGLIAQTFTAAPGFSDGTYLQTFWSPSTNNAGQTAFLSRVRIGSGTSAVDTYVVYRTDGTDMEVIARQGQSLQGLLGGETLGRIRSTGVNINANGDVSFTAEILDASGDSYVEEVYGLFGPRQSRSALLVRDGQIAPDVVDGALLDLFQGTAPVINANGDMMFVAQLRTGAGPEVTSLNDTALFFYDANTDTISLVVREGDLVDIDLDPNNELLAPVRGIGVLTNFAGESRNLTAFNDSGLIAAQLTFGVSTSGVFLIDPRGGVIPEPSTAGMLLAALLGILHRRARHVGRSDKQVYQSEMSFTLPILGTAAANHGS